MKMLSWVLQWMLEVLQWMLEVRPWLLEVLQNLLEVTQWLLLAMSMPGTGSASRPSKKQA